jgi:hypothetical protein
MDQLPPIDSPKPGGYFPGHAAEPHLRRAAELTAELIDLVAEVRAQLDEPSPREPEHTDPAPDVEPTVRRGLARGEMRDAFAAASAVPRRQPRELSVSPVDETDGGREP